MSNPEHIDLLRQGPEVWNAWRAEHLSVHPDFAGADLKEMELSGAEFSNKNMREFPHNEQQQIYNIEGRLDRWRLDNPKVEPDFSGADLRGTNFSNCRLNNAKFYHSDLRCANFTKSRMMDAVFDIDPNLEEANFSEADLRGSRISNHAKCNGTVFDGADLIGAKIWMSEFVGATFANGMLNESDFWSCNLRNSSFADAYICGTRFKRVDFSRSVFRSAHLSETVLIDVTLNSCRDLETCVHHSPSTVDYRTIENSWPLPQSFLRGVGFPESWVEYIPSLMAVPIEFYSCFISYSSMDQEFADRLYTDLQRKGVRCWFAPETLKIGERTRYAIHEAIRHYDKLLLILSDNSICSDWVEDEVERALEQERKATKTILFPIRLDDTVMHCDVGWPVTIQNTRNIGNFTQWKDHDSYKKAFDRLIRDLRVEDTTNAE